MHDVLNLLLEAREKSNIWSRGRLHAFRIRFLSNKLKDVVMTREIQKTTAEFLLWNGTCPKKFPVFEAEN